MTEDEQRLAIEEAAKIIAGYDEFLGFSVDEARAILAPMFAKITALEAENAALRERLVVDDAMVKRAEIAWGDEFHRTIRRESASYRCMRAALTAALASKDHPK